MTRAKARFLTAFLPILASACASTGAYPSLAEREVERISGSGTPVAGEAEAPAPALPPASADLVTRLEGLVAIARDADRQFQSSRAVAERAVASAGATASDSWSSASVALAKLQLSRSQAMVALGDLDTLYADARDAAPTDLTPTTQAIATARDQVIDWVEGQDAVIARLEARLQG